MVFIFDSSQSYSNDEHSLESRDVLHSSSGPSNRHSVGLVPAVYNGSLPPSKLLKWHVLKRWHNN